MTATLEPDALACTTVRPRLIAAAKALEEHGNDVSAAALLRLADYMDPERPGTGMADTARALLGEPLATALATEDTYRTAECEMCGQEADIDGESAFIDHACPVSPAVRTWHKGSAEPADVTTVADRDGILIRRLPDVGWRVASAVDNGRGGTWEYLVCHYGPVTEVLSAPAATVGA